MSITVREKEHWKERIARKIERAITDLVAANIPQYLEETAAEARQLAIADLGGQELVDRIQEIERAREKLKLELENAERALVALARGKPRENPGYYYNPMNDWETAVTQRAAAREQDLMARDPLGQRILKLRHEQEELLDTVWLATSPVQIRALWQSVSELLADSPTPLQQRALAAPAIAEESA